MIEWCARVNGLSVERVSTMKFCHAKKRVVVALDLLHGQKARGQLASSFADVCSWFPGSKIVVVKNIFDIVSWANRVTEKALLTRFLQLRVARRRSAAAMLCCIEPCARSATPTRERVIREIHCSFANRV